MKNSIRLFIVLVFCLGEAFGQAQSRHKVWFMVTQVGESSEYQVWVVPNYDTPNAYNGGAVEKGATAQVSLKVPADFNIRVTQEMNGSWDKSPYKLVQGPILEKHQVQLGNSALFVIGKDPIETNYGIFQAYNPTPLFRFQGNYSLPEDSIKIVDSQDFLVKELYDKMSLNVVSSFYSRSGQVLSPSARPLEQFEGQLKIKDLVGSIVDQESGLQENQWSVYPNPFKDRLTVLYFSKQDAEEEVSVELTDLAGRIWINSPQAVRFGLNELSFEVPKLPAGVYVIRGTSGTSTVSFRLLKE